MKTRSKTVKLGISLLISGVSIALYVGSHDGIEPKKPLAQIGSNQSYVSHVYDGDTLEVSSGLQKFKVRLIGVDTPEVVDPRKPEQCFGEAASAHTKKFVPIGTIVRVEYDDTQGKLDKYGRTLAYIYLPNGQMLNYELVADGYAHEYTYNSNPYKYQSQFVQAQTEARTKQLGLWSPSTCNGNTTQAAR